MKLFLLAAVLTTGCIAEPAIEAETTSSVTAAETVISPPKPFLYCVDCSLTHETGSTMVIQTSYHGECHDLWDYDCQPQGYMLKIECPGCEVNGEVANVHAVWFEPTVELRGTRVRFPTAGEFPVKLTVNGPNGATTQSKTIKTATPDRIGFTCSAGTPAVDMPCDSPLLRSPVTLVFSLMAGTQPVHAEDMRFAVAANLSGQLFLDRQWQTNEVGLLALTVSRGTLTTEFNRTISPSLDGIYMPQRLQQQQQVD